MAWWTDLAVFSFAVALISELYNGFTVIYEGFTLTYFRKILLFDGRFFFCEMIGFNQVRDGLSSSVWGLRARALPVADAANAQHVQRSKFREHGELEILGTANGGSW